MNPKKTILVLAVVTHVMAADLKFEVASIRRPIFDRDALLAQELDILQMMNGGKRAPAAPSPILAIHGNRLDLESIATQDLIGLAYGVDPALVAGPSYLRGRWTIHALLPAGATKEQIPEMLRSLLNERFHFVAHQDNARQDAWALVTTASGPQLASSRDLDRSTCAPWVPDQGQSGVETCSITKTNGKNTVVTTEKTDSSYGPWESRLEKDLYRTEFFRISMRQLALYLTIKLSTTNYSHDGETTLVVDASAIEGDWNIVLQDTVTNPDTVSIPLKDMLPPLDSYQKALSRIGFKLEHTKTSVDRLVVDHIDSLPTEN